jgi:hypothetical protein
MNEQEQHTDGSASRLLGVNAAATYLGITPRSVYRLVEQGLLIPVRLPGLRRPLFDKRNLEDLAELSRAASPSIPHRSVGCDGGEELAEEIKG